MRPALARRRDRRIAAPAHRLRVGPLARRKYATLRPGAVETKGGGHLGRPPNFVGPRAGMPTAILASFVLQFGLLRVQIEL
jgi:hypothetical protein